MKKRIGVVGGNGKLGSLLRAKDGFFPLDCDVTDLDSILVALDKVRPDLIVNASCISSIEACEADYKKAIKVNVHGTANLHKAFGAGVLSISSDHVFSGKSSRNSEKSYTEPVNNYGMTKLGQEVVAQVWDGKIIRLSRTVSIEDKDISDYLLALYKHEEIEVPTFLYRNFIHRQFAVDAIEYFANNFETMPNTVHYGGLDNYNFYNFMILVAEEFGFDPELVIPRKHNNPSYAPRPTNGGFSVKLAMKLNFPMYRIGDTVSRMAKEANL